MTTEVFPKVVARNTPLGLDGSMQQMLHILKGDRLEEQEGGVLAFSGSPDQLIALIIHGCIGVAQRDRQRGFGKLNLRLQHAKSIVSDGPVGCGDLCFCGGCVYSFFPKEIAVWLVIRKAANNTHACPCLPFLPRFPMLAEAYPWWIFLVFIAAFVVGWKLIGRLYDRFAPGTQKRLGSKATAAGARAFGPGAGEQGKGA